MKLYAPLFIGSLFVTSVAALGCSSDTPDVVDDSNGKAISEVAVTPEKATLTKGATLQFHASVTYSDGTTKDVTSDAETLWNTSDPEVATVNKTGMVTGVSEGDVDITANYKGVEEDESFIVTP